MPQPSIRLPLSSPGLQPIGLSKRNCILARGMKKVVWMPFLLVIGAHFATGQTRSPYGVWVHTAESYQRTVKENPAKRLVNLAEFIPGLVLDIRYATEHNFMGRAMYAQAKAYARQPVAEALRRVQADLAPQGLGLKIYDAYRPYAVTVAFYESYRDTTYVASPYRGSRHNRGCALDLTLIDLKTGQELPMPTGFDSFEKAAWPSTPVADPVIRKNRDTLIRAMARHGFRVNASEWWHFDFRGWQQYEILDVPFEQLN